MKNISRILWGIVLIAVGLILGLNALDITDINIFFDGWWTLFIIVPCFIDLFKEKDKTGNIIGIIIGLLLLLSCQDILEFDIIWKLFIPIVLVIIGLSFIFKNSFENKVNKKIKELNTNDKEKGKYCATFSGQKVDFTNEEFTGCTIDAVFGSVGLDLTNAIIKEDTVINVSAVFGGVDIHVPNNVNVMVNATSIFGGTSNKVNNKKDNKITIYVNATALFGGIEIK